jgi:hypothetical protein
MVYYLGSDCEAPLTAPWSEASPKFHVTEPRDCELVVCEQLPFSCVRYIGAHTGCGCGFRRDRGGYIDADPDDLEEARAAQADHDALLAYLRALPPQSRPMQIYGCWSGDENRRAEHFRSCSIAELASPDFGFRERELLTLRRMTPLFQNPKTPNRALQRTSPRVTSAATNPQSKTGSGRATRKPSLSFQSLDD